MECLMAGKFLIEYEKINNFISWENPKKYYRNKKNCHEKFKEQILKLFEKNRFIFYF